MSTVNGKLFGKVLKHLFLLQKLSVNLFVFKVKFLHSEYFPNCYGIIRKSRSLEFSHVILLQPPPSDQSALS